MEIMKKNREIDICFTSDEGYAQHLSVAIVSILYNSEYYQAVLLMGVLLAVMTILFNLWLIPKYGIEGAAIASFLAFFVYNTIKLLYVKLKFGILPFTSNTLKVLILLVAVGIPFYFVDFSDLNCVVCKWRKAF